MATASVIATFCNANTGAHADVTLRVNNVVQGTYPMSFDDISGTVTDEEKQTFARLLIKLRKIGNTNAQLRADLLAGFSVTV